MALGVMTPQTYLLDLLGQLATQSVLSDEVQIATTLEELSEPAGQFVDPALKESVLQAAGDLKSGRWGRSQFLQSRLYHRLEGVRNTLDLGEGSVAEALAAISSVDTAGSLRRLPIARPAVRASIGPPPEIRWEEFGTVKNPMHPPKSPEASSTAGRRLAYALRYIAACARAGETEMAVEAFLKISPEQRRKLDRGDFVPKALGQFSSAQVQFMIGQAANVERRFGLLVQELFIHAIFESQGWSLGVPLPQASWDIYMLYWLRRYVALQIISGNKKILEDPALVKIVQGKSRLTDTKWHTGKVRRDIFEPWLVGASFGKRDKLDAMCRRIGDDFVRLWKWQPPKNGSGWELQVQWMVRQWIAYYHYGVLPARGLPFHVDVIRRFAVAKPANVQPQFARQLLAMMRDYFSKVELDAVGGLIK